MSEKEKRSKYSINFTEDDIVGCYVRAWVMEWVRKYHPEAFIEAEKFVKEYLKKDEV